MYFTNAILQGPLQTTRLIQTQVAPIFPTFAITLRLCDSKNFWTLSFLKTIQE